MSGDLLLIRPTQSGGWEVRSNGELNPISIFDSEHQAVDFARAVARHLHCGLALHRGDGSVLHFDGNGDG